MDFLKKLKTSIESNALLHAFCINDKFYTYQDLDLEVSKIRYCLRNNIFASEKRFGLIVNDDIYTYAAMVALWFEGKAYVPITLNTPQYRCNNIIEQAKINYVFDSVDEPLLPDFNRIDCKTLNYVEINRDIVNCDPVELVYILFTSGTSGVPKGVPITRANLAAFIDSFDRFKLNLEPTDRVLQMFELTFDVSIMSFLLPLLSGACVYTIPKDAIKYNYISKLFDEKDITVCFMVPSVIQYLRPYFSEIHCSEMRYCLFAGEALLEDLVKGWSTCVPNAKIINAYGPTENTIVCTYYEYQRSKDNKIYNGIISIGLPMHGNEIVIINDRNEILPANQIGEMCLAGPQLTPGYWNNDGKNSTSFFELEYKGIIRKFYKTGDLCFIDDEGYIMYLGRIDFQAKIQGCRVEISEVEFYIKQFLNKANVVALPFKNEIGNTELGLVIEGENFDTNPLFTFLKTKLPNYMIPSEYRFTKEFPLNESGKIDRKPLTILFNNK